PELFRRELLAAGQRHDARVGLQARGPCLLGRRGGAPQCEEREAEALSESSTTRNESSASTCQRIRLGSFSRSSASGFPVVSFSPSRSNSRAPRAEPFCAKIDRV